MAFKQASPIDMVGLEILNVRLQNLAGAPSSPGVGQVWFDTTLQTLLFRTSTTTVDLRARAAHTGTQLASTISDFDTQVRLSRPEQLALPTATFSLNNQKIASLANGTLSGDAVNYAQLQAVLAQITLTRLDQLAAPTSSVNLNTQKITNLANGTLSGDAVNFSQLQAVTTGVTSTRLDQFAAPTAPVNFGSQKLTNVANGTNAQDAATYGQLLNAINGMDWKQSVRATSTGNVSLAAPGATLDGVTLAVNDRVLLKNQSTASQNGIYVWTGAAAALTRTADAVQGTLTADAAVFVEEGTQADTQWRLTTDGIITVDTTAQTWAQIGAAVSYTNGAGLTLTGNVFAIDTAVVVRKFAATIGDGSTTNIAVTHNLGTLDVTVGVYEVSTGAEIGCDKTRTNVNTVTIGFAIAPTAGQYRVVVHA
jgi:hypothetical protein